MPIWLGFSSVGAQTGAIKLAMAGTYRIGAWRQFPPLLGY